MQPMDCFQQSIGHTGPLRSVKTAARVTGFYKLMKDQTNNPSNQISFGAIRLF